MKTAIYDCPLPATHDKFDEAHYFLHRSMREFHEPDAFRWNLNAFLQALRSVTLMLQSELQKQPNFKTWYLPWQESMKQDELLRRFVEGRNTVVHKGMLQHRSRVEVGRFLGYELRMGFAYEIDINLPSSDILRHLIDTSTFIDKEHVFIGEQLGVHRTWIVDDLGQGGEDVLILCHHAFSSIANVVTAAHKFTGRDLPLPDGICKEHDLTRVSVFLETDLDPTLPQKWGW